MFLVDYRFWDDGWGWKLGSILLKCFMAIGRIRSIYVLAIWIKKTQVFILVSKSWMCKHWCAINEYSPSIASQTPSSKETPIFKITSQLAKVVCSFNRRYLCRLNSTWTPKSPKWVWTDVNVHIHYDMHINSWLNETCT